MPNDLVDASSSGQSRTPAKDGTSSAVGSPATPTPAPRKSSRKSSSLATRVIHSQEVLAPKTVHYEFGGPVGALFVTLTVPFFSYALYYFCNPLVGCAILPKYPGLLFKQMGDGVIESFTDVTGWAIYFGWYAFTVLAWAFIPGKWEEGTELRTGDRVLYKINGE